MRGAATMRTEGNFGGNWGWTKVQAVGALRVSVNNIVFIDALCHDKNKSIANAVSVSF